MSLTLLLRQASWSPPFNSLTSVPQDSQPWWPGCSCQVPWVSSTPSLQVEILYEDEPLKEYYTLMDIAYIYPWRRVSLRAGDRGWGQSKVLPDQVWPWPVAMVS